METPGNQFDDAVQEIRTLTLSEQGVETKGAAETLVTGLETGDAEETRKSHDRGEEEDEEISGAAGSENNQLQEESTGLVKLDAYSEAAATEEELLEQWGRNIKSMMELINSHILFGQGGSIMDVARTIKEKNSQPPKPFKFQDWMFMAGVLKEGQLIKGNLCQPPKPFTVEDWIFVAEVVECGQLICLWCACCSADGNQANIVWCLDRMNGIVIETVNEVERIRLGKLLCFLSEDVEAVLETPNDLGDDWFIHITLRCLRNKASGLVQQLMFSEGIQVYESCIMKIRQRLGENVLLGQFLTILGKLRLSLVADSPEGLKNFIDARTVLQHAVTTSDSGNQDRITLLEFIDNTLGVERDEKASTSKPEDSRKEKPLHETKRKSGKKFRPFFQMFQKREKRSSPSSSKSLSILMHAVHNMNFTTN